MRNKLNVALVCMPFFYHVPSIQLASLKSFVKKRLPEVNIDILNFHLKILKCTELKMGRIQKRDMIFIESLYASLLYPKLGMFYEYPRANKISKTKGEMKIFLEKLKNCQEKLFKEIDWSKYKIVGFSTSFNQLLSSLYLIKKIKGKNPDIKILIGGTNVVGEKGKSLMEQFKEIDLAISGEGELNFYHILKSEIEGNEDYKKLKGIIYRENEKVVFNQGFNQLEDLNDLEFPDYSDYFRYLKRYNIKESYVKLPIEFSRGCFYCKCCFCNFYTCWKGYRMKKVSRVLEEIKYFNKNYGVNEFYFCDSILLEIKLRELFEGIKKLNLNIKILALQLKTSLSPSTFKLLHEAGVKSVTLGIETFSSSLLKKMNKPSNLMYNVQTMKICEMYGICVCSGLISNYPLVTEEEIKETLENIELIKHYRPSVESIFKLQLSSDIYKNPEKYGIKILGNEYNYKYLFPPRIRDRLNLEYKQYEIEEKVDWSRVLEKLEEWRKEYFILKGKSELPILYHINKNGKIIVVRRMLNGKDVYKLDKTESGIYQYCDTSKTFEEIKNKFKETGEKKLNEVIKELKKKNLFFESDGKFLSLSIDSKKYVKARLPKT